MTRPANDFIRRPTARTSAILLLMTGVLACALPGTVAPLRAQEPTPATAGPTPIVQMRGRGDPATDRFIRDLLQAKDYLLITSDTVVARNDTIRTRVVVVGATLRLDGVILGDLVGIGANLFIRPSAHVAGTTRNIAGGLYPSELATLAGRVSNEPTAQYEVQRAPGTLTIVGLVNPSFLELPGIFGLDVPTYDRVNGLTLRWAPGVLLPRLGDAEPIVRGSLEYYSHRGDFGSGAELAVRRRWTEVAAGLERTTLTNERWIRSDLTNSLSMLLQGKDYRNYYAADRAYVRLDRTIEKGPRTTSLSLTGQVEKASGLAAGQPWSLFKPDSVRPNHYGLADGGNLRYPAGRTSSIIAAAQTEWDQPRFIVEANALTEFGISAFDGESTFGRFEVGGEIAMAALRRNTLEFEWYFQGPLPGTDSLPYSRWSYVGGSGTLHTFPVAAFPGDRVAFVETTYTLPLPAALTLPLLGTPALDLLHYVAMAWSQDEKRRFEQNVGFRFGYRVAYLRVITDPRDFGNPKISVGVTLPRKTYPWQKE